MNCPSSTIAIAFNTHFHGNSHLYYLSEWLYYKGIQVLRQHNTLSFWKEKHPSAIIHKVTNQATLYTSFNITYTTRKDRNSSTLFLLGGQPIPKQLHMSKTIRIFCNTKLKPRSAVLQREREDFGNNNDKGHIPCYYESNCKGHRQA